MNIRKILWPTDFSSRAEAALPYVRSLSRQYGAETHVLHVIEDISHHEGWYGEFGKDHIERLKEQLKERASKRLDQICRDHLEGCPLFIRHVAVGDPAREILGFIERQQVDAVIMATKGTKNGGFFGSVAERVVKNSPVPVTTIPSGSHGLTL